MAEPKFGPAGNSESFAAAGFKKSEDAPAWLAQMGLTAFEYQCGRGVRCGEETALKIGAAAKQHGIQMSIHAPYFINLSSEESERMEKNVGYVLETARLAVPLGATRMVVHCGGQGKLTRDRAMRNSHENVKNILRALIDRIHAAREDCDAIIMNAGAYTHYSYAIRDAIAAVRLPCVEVHMSNVHAREEFRHKSVIGPVCAGVIAGFGKHSYLLAVDAVKSIIG